MAVYLIAYDLYAPEKNNGDVLAHIEKYKSRFRLSETSYVIFSPETASAVYDEIKPSLDENDVLYVLSLRKPFSGQGEVQANKWLRDNLETCF